MLRKKKNKMAKTIVYCKSIKDCGKLFRLFKYELGSESFHSDNESSREVTENLLFGMFHSVTLQKHQNRVMDSFYKHDGTCRLVFATNALGMGINFPDVRVVVNYGPPHDVEEFVQEMGRGGRDRKLSYGVLLYTGHQLKNCEKLIKDYCSTTACLRQKLYSSFEVPESMLSPTVGHNCCLSCHKNCKCGECGCPVPMPDFGLTNGSDKELNYLPTRNASREQKSLLKQLLVDYQKAQESVGGPAYFGQECACGFTNSLINAVVKECKFKFTLEYILNNLPVFKVEHAVAIIKMIENVFEDICTSDIVCPVEYELVTDVHDLEYGAQYEFSDSSDLSDIDDS